RLPRRTASGHGHVNVEPLRRLCGKQRLLDDHLQNVVGKVVVETALVDRDRTGTGNEPDPRHRALAAPGGFVLDFDRQNSSSVSATPRRGEPQAAAFGEAVAPRGD